MKIFISYRRDDSAGHAGRLFDHLTAHFGAQQIFMDIDTIQPGEDFRAAIHNAMGTCDVVLVMIGKQWLNATDAQGKRRLDDARDWVRAEIGSALANPNVRVIPVLVRDAGMPAANELPDDLKELAWRNAIELSDNRFQYDANKLIGVIEQLDESPSKRLAGKIFQSTAQKLGAAVFALIVLGILIWVVVSRFILGVPLTPGRAATATDLAVLATDTLSASMPDLEPIATDVSITSTVPPAATETIAPTPAGLVTKYFDNFKYGIDTTIWQASLSDWKADNERISAAQIYNGARMFIGSAEWQDYQVTVNTSSSNGERTSYVAAIYVRYQDEDNFVQFVFDCDFPASTVIWQYKQHGNLTRVAATERELSTCKGEPYTIQLSVRGTQYEAKIDGETTAFPLDLFQNGLVGLYSGENGGEASAAFDNFLIEP